MTLEEKEDAARKVMQKVWDSWFENNEREEISWFMTTDPVLMHMSLGQFIRNEVCLWSGSWNPELVNGIDYSAEHPDSISMRVIEQFQQSKKQGYTAN